VICVELVPATVTPLYHSPPPCTSPAPCQATASGSFVVLRFQPRILGTDPDPESACQITRVPRLLICRSRGHIQHSCALLYTPGSRRFQSSSFITGRNSDDSRRSSGNWSARCLDLN